MFSWSGTTLPIATSNLWENLTPLNVRHLFTHTKQMHITYLIHIFTILCGLGSVVGIATGYRLDGPGIESRWGV